MTEPVHQQPKERQEPKAKIWTHTALSCGLSVIICLFGYIMNHHSFDSTLFLVVPFITGLCIAFMSKGKGMWAISSLSTLIFSVLILMVSGLEGFPCVIMSMPILFSAIICGAGIGYFIGPRFIKGYGNHLSVLLCIITMILLSWANDSEPVSDDLIVTTSIEIEAPLNEVWQTVVQPQRMYGNTAALKFLGLPVPEYCIVDGDVRMCFFDKGVIKQQIVVSDPGKELLVHIHESNIDKYPWITFKQARYTFEEISTSVRVTRTDIIASSLSPRWYWAFFEAHCISLEHDYVLECVKSKAEQ